MVKSEQDVITAVRFFGSCPHPPTFFHPPFIWPNAVFSLPFLAPSYSSGPSFMPCLLDLIVWFDFWESMSDTHSHPPPMGFSNASPSFPAVSEYQVLSSGWWVEQMWAQVSVVLPEGKGDKKNDFSASEILSQRGTPIYLPFQGHSHPFWSLGFLWPHLTEGLEKSGKSETSMQTDFL